MDQVVTKLVISLMLALNCNNYLVDPKFNTTRFANLTTDVFDPNQGREITINHILGFDFKNESCPDDVSRGGLTFFDYDPNVLEAGDQYARMRRRRRAPSLLVFKVLADRKCSAIRRDFGKELEAGEKSSKIFKLFICNLCGDDNSNQCERRLGLYVDSRWPTIEFNLANADPSRANLLIALLRRNKLIDDQSRQGIRSNWLRALFIKSHQPVAQQLKVEGFCPQVCTPIEPLPSWFWLWLIALVFGVLGLPFYICCGCLLINRYYQAVASKRIAVEMQKKLCRSNNAVDLRRSRSYEFALL